MQYYFEKSLQKIKELLETPRKREWNAIARLEGYLLAESLEYMSDMSFIELCQKVREELAV